MLIICPKCKICYNISEVEKEMVKCGDCGSLYYQYENRIEANIEECLTFRKR